VCLSPPEVASVSDSSLPERNPIPAAFNKGNVYGDKAYPRDKMARPRRKNEAGYIRYVSSWISKIRVDFEQRKRPASDPSPSGAGARRCWGEKVLGREGAVL
jgi:hypothetical protein